MGYRMCSIDGCERKHYARDFCASHYQRERLKDPSRPRCSMQDCAEAEYARQLCQAHYVSDQLTGYWQKPEIKVRHRDADKRWYEANREQVRQYSAAWRVANRDRIAETRRAWRESNPERYRELGRRSDGLRRAREADAQIGEVDFAAILERDGMICHICTDPIEPDDLHFDHVVPLSKGGPHTYDNIRPAHSWCNLRKGTKLLDQPRR